LLKIDVNFIRKYHPLEKVSLGFHHTSIVKNNRFGCFRKGMKIKIGNSTYVEGGRNVLHEGDEGQKGVRGRKKCPS
jgi:hypothetical protein